MYNSAFEAEIFQIYQLDKFFYLGRNYDPRRKI